MVWRYTTENCIRVWKWYTKVGPAEIVKNAAIGCVKVGAALLPLIAVGPTTIAHRPTIIPTPQIRARPGRKEESPYGSGYDLSPGSLNGEQVLPYENNYGSSSGYETYPKYADSSINSIPEVSTSTDTIISGNTTTPNNTTSTIIPGSNNIPEPNSGILLVASFIVMGMVFYIIKKYKGR